MNIRHVEMRVYVVYTLKVGETKSGVCGVPLLSHVLSWMLRFAAPRTAAASGAASDESVW